MNKTYSKMNPKIKKKWVKALRSGKYKQGRGGLLTKKNTEWDPRDAAFEKGLVWPKQDQYCCLGVLCDVAGKDERYWKSNGHLSRPVAEEFKISGEVQDTLICKNDGRKWSFKKIADWIEKNL